MAGSKGTSSKGDVAPGQAARTAPTRAARAAPAKPPAPRAVPRKAAPAKATPAKAVPAKTVPAKTVPAKTVPAKTVPAKTVPAAGVSAGSASEPAPTRPLSPREARRQQRIDLSREQILDTAEQLFGERGYHETGLKDVAERCEFSVGTLYSFFDSKDTLYQDVLQRRSLGQWAEMRRIVADPGPADERLMEMARMQVEYFRKYPAWGRLTTRVLTPGLPVTAEVPAGFQESYREAITLEAQIFAAGQREGVVRAGDPRALARLFSALVSAFHLMDPQVSDDSADLGADEFLAFVADTFAPKRDS